MKSGAGYTLIELLISISIFGILAGITLFGFRGVGKANVLKQASAELVANLRMIQSLATSGGSVMTCSDTTPLKACPPAVCQGSTRCDTPAAPPGGYGIVVTGTGYTMFANMTKTDAEYNTSLDPVVKMGSVTLADNIAIKAYKTLEFYMLETVTFSGPRGLPSIDAIFCFSRSDLPALHNRVKVLKDTGQIIEETVTACP